MSHITLSARGTIVLVVMVLLSIMSHPAFSQTEAAISSAVSEPKVEIVMFHKMFKVTKGGGEIGQPTFRLEAGKFAHLVLRNRDKVAHEFVSPIFRMTDLQMHGDATIIWTDRAAGVRVDPGQTVELQFWVPAFLNRYEPFWCNVHGREHGDPMRGEVIVAGVRGATKRKG